MTDTDADGQGLHETLEEHELAVKRAVESMGELQAELRAVAADEDGEEATRRLADLGRRLETHEDRLEALVETLDEHKRVLRRVGGAERDALAEARARARRRARQESGPPTARESDDT